MKAAPTERVIVRTWNRPQTAFLKCTDRYVDFEGAVRAGKTTPLVWKLINYMVEYPGIQCMLTRWTQDALDAQLKPKFYEECPVELLGRWSAKEEFQEFHNGSRVYMRALKTSDDSARYSKISGLTLGVIGVDQPEEIPEDVYAALKARLSQPGFPQQLLLCPNPPAPNHWLVSEFPEDNHIPGHTYLLTSVYDNRAILGDTYIAELEREYPAGHVLRRRFIEGRRGLSITGQPVYGAVFSRHMHVQDVEYLPDFPLVESWDFGQKHPAVSWHQFLPWGHWNVLGSWMGTRQFIDEAVPAVAALRTEWFPGLTTLRVCCDPAGADKQGHGLRTTAVDVLNQHLRMIYGPGTAATFVKGANAPSKREWCLQQIAGYMSRLIHGRPALLVHPSRCEVIVDGFEAGYVYDDRTSVNALLPNVRRAKKDGYYDHLQNTVEYAMLTYGNRTFDQQSTVDDARQRARILQQADVDPDDVPMRRVKNRSGY